AVAGEFIDHAIIPVDAPDEAAQEIVDQIENRFGAERSRKMCEADGVGKKHRDFTAFAPQPFLIIQDTFGYDRGNIAAQPAHRLLGFGEFAPKSDRIDRGIIGRRPGQRRAALSAACGSFNIYEAASRTKHTFIVSLLE
ncbi:MAG TPA: hypothetical protein VII92_13660, partial [Anaerolineae bacterium]